MDYQYILGARIKNESTRIKDRILEEVVAGWALDQYQKRQRDRGS